MDFNLPRELVDYLAELDSFIDTEIRPLEAADDNIRFFDHRREWARTDFDRGGLPSGEWEELLREAKRRADAAGHLRFTLPSPEALARAFGARGIGEDTRVVLYARGRNVWATRVWWLLRYVGVDSAAVLDGGWEKWLQEKRPASVDVPVFEPCTLTARPRADVFVGKEAVSASLDDPETCLINALDAELHRGDNGRYGRRGRIPGSVNVPSASLVDAQSNAFLSASEAAALFARVGVDPAKPTIVYCGGGIAATLDAFILYQLGHEQISIYDASMSEWARDETLPIETG